MARSSLYVPSNICYSYQVPDYSLSLYRVQPVAAGCIIAWDAALPLMQCPPYQCIGTYFANLGRMTG